MQVIWASFYILQYTDNMYQATNQQQPWLSWVWEVPYLLIIKMDTTQPGSQNKQTPISLLDPVFPMAGTN